MKRIISFVLLLSLTALFCACGTSTEENFNSEFVSDGSSVTLGGFEMTFGVSVDKLTNVDITDNVLGYEQTSLFADSARNRLSDVEKTLDCKINIFSDASTSIFELSTAAGSYYCDVLMSNSNSTTSWAKAGYIVGITTLDDVIDYTDSAKWGEPNLLEVTFYDGDLYGVIPAAWPELSYTSFGYPMVGNVDLIKSLGGSDPRDYVEAGTWNWETFEKVLVACTVDNGEDSVYGLMTHYPYFAQMILASNGVTFAMTNDEGETICGYYTDAGRRALDEVAKIYCGELSYTVCKENDGDATISMENFINGKGVFTFTPAHCIFGSSGAISSAMENYAILPTPYGTDSDASNKSGLYHSMYYCISFPVTADSPDETSTIVNAIFEPFENMQTTQDIIDYMSRYYFFNEADAETFFEMRRTAKLNYDYQTDFTSRRIPENVCSGKESVTQILDSYKTSIDTILEEVVVPMQSTYSTLFK